MLRAIMICALATRCDGADGREPGPPAAGTGIHVETSEASTGEDQPRLDLGAMDLWSTGDTTGGSSSTGSTGEDIEPTTSGESGRLQGAGGPRGLTDC